MGFTTIQNTPITLDLLTLGKSKGWEIFTDYATHEVCNAGSMVLKQFLLTSGHAYQISYNLEYINTGFIRADLGTASSSNRTTPGFVSQTITATGTNPVFSFYSNANLKITSFDIRDTTEDFGLKQRNTISWSEKSNKWVSYKTYNPDWGFSMFTNLFTYKSGQLWAHKASISPRNNFYGQQYKSIMNMVFNSGVGQPKTFHSISYEGNNLMVTTDDGVKTSLGQISDLVDANFLKDVLDDGVTQVNIYSVEGVFSSSFRRANPDVINGSELKGTYITVELINVNNDLLRLENVVVTSVPSKIGAR